METSGRIWPNFELIQAFMHVLIACKYEKDLMKNSGDNVMTSFSPLKVYGIFFRRSRADNSVVHGRISPNFELIQALMYIIVTCKYEMNPIKNIRENVMTPFSHCNPICCHGNQWSHLAEFRTHSSSHACPHYLEI